MLLSEFIEFYNKIDVVGQWKSSEHFKNVILNVCGDDYEYETSGRDSSGARFKRGVYRHTAIIDDEEHVIYIGKAEGLSSSIATRQTRHLHSYCNVDFRGEMSGKKYRQLMEDYKIEELLIIIDYVDMTNMPPAMIPMFERMSIEHFAPMINQ